MSKEFTGRFIEFSKPFIDASKNIFETMVFTQITPTKPTIKETSVSNGDVSAIIGLSGTVERDGVTSDFIGMLILSFPFETYVKIAAAMLMEEYTEYNDDIADVGAEISNIITGNAKRELGGKGYKLDMSVPTTISGKGHVIKYPEKTTVIQIPMKCAHGDFYMEICYQD